MPLRIRVLAWIACLGLLGIGFVGSSAFGRLGADEARSGRVADATVDAVVLGSASFAPNGAGWGTARPPRIFNGGDPSGLVTHIRWSRWGQPVATGHGFTRSSSLMGGTTRGSPILSCMPPTLDAACLVGRLLTAGFRFACLRIRGASLGVGCFGAGLLRCAPDLDGCGTAKP